MDFKTINPTSLNRQDNDREMQYRTGIYYTDKADLPVIEKAVCALVREYKKPLAIEIKPLTNFYIAEGYYEDYLEIESSETVKSDKTGIGYTINWMMPI